MRWPIFGPEPLSDDFNGDYFPAEMRCEENGDQTVADG